MSDPPPPERRGRLCVVGPLRLDHVASINTLPQPGQTVTANEFTIRHGGRGANQAIAAARQGAKVSLIGALGPDAAGRDFHNHLVAAGVSTHHLKQTSLPTGAAFLDLLPSGQWTSVVFPGANHTLTPEDVTSAAEAIAESAFLLIQLELPVETVVTAMQIANRSGTQVIFNPSPFSPNFPWSEVFIDILLVNEIEAGQLDAATPAGEDLPVGSLIITHGTEPVEVITPEGDFSLRPPHGTSVDEASAGDTFAGTLAARLALGDSLSESVTAANTAAAQSIF